MADVLSLTAVWGTTISPLKPVSTRALNSAVSFCSGISTVISGSLPAAYHTARRPEPARIGLCTLNYDVGTIARGGATCPANECGSESGVNWLVDAVEARVAQASGRAERLRQALLAKAFRGELVPQAPNDDPAEVLMEPLDGSVSAHPQLTGIANHGRS